MIRIVFALYSCPRFFETLFLIIVIWFLDVKFSSSIISRKLIELTHFISLSFMKDDGSFNGIFSSCQALTRRAYWFYLCLVKVY